MSDKRISRRNVKKEFSFVGLTLIIYSLFFLIMPQLLLEYLKLTNSFVLENQTVFFGVYYIFVLLSIIPFLLLKSSAGIKFSRMARKVNAGFIELLSQALVFFTLTSLSMYIFNAIAIRFGQGSLLIGNIGNVLNISYLNNPMYLFMFIIACPFMEEFIFRGVLLSYLSRYGKRFGVIATSFLYALAHYYFVEMIPAFIMGYLLAKSQAKYKSIQTPIVIHILFNLFIYILCVIPNSIAGYVPIALLVIYVIAIILIITNNYKYVHLPRSSNKGIVEQLFFTRFTIILTIILMILKSVLFRLL